MSEIILNTNLYSRQIGTYGLNTMIKLSKLNIYIYGQRGLGIEIAKNIILAGPRSVTIFDDKKASINDLTANFYITEKDVEEGKRLDEASIINLSSLNPYVKLSIMKNGKIIDNLHENVVKNKEKYDVVIISEFLPKDEIIIINKFCRDNKIGFIYGCAFGINTFCFVDFGNDFTVYEHSSEKSKSYTIKSIIKGNPGIVNLVENIDMTELGNDDYVIFKEIEGMNELINKEIQIKIIDKNNIKINDNSNFSDYIYGGIMQKVEKSSKINFESFEKKVEEPYNESDGYPNEIDCESSNIEEEKILKNKNYNETKKRSGINTERLNAIKNEIMNFDFWKCNLNNFIKIPEFEKDDDKNGHIDFIYAASNLRATIYKIEKCDKIKTKLIAGKIIPAVASTTAAIVGLVSLQLYTLCQTNEIKYLRNSYLNLSLNSIIFQSPSKFQETNEEIEQINNKKNSIFDLFHKINFNILKINKYN